MLLKNQCKLKFCQYLPKLLHVFVSVGNVGNVSIHIAKDVNPILELMQKENNVTGARVDKVLEISKTLLSRGTFGSTSFPLYDQQ